jgi:hypothetical protein
MVKSLLEKAGVFTEIANNAEMEIERNTFIALMCPHHVHCSK